MKNLKLILPLSLVGLLVIAGIGYWVFNNQAKDEEIAASLNSLNQFADKDADDLPDDLEMVFSSDPELFDTDSDGYGDGEEVFNGFNPAGEGQLQDAQIIGSLPLDEALGFENGAECLMKIARPESDLEVTVFLYMKDGKFRQELYPLQRGVPADSNLILIKDGVDVYFGTNTRPDSWVKLEYSDSEGLAKNEFVSLEGQTLLNTMENIEILEPSFKICFQFDLDESLFEVDESSILSPEDLEQKSEAAKSDVGGE